MKYWYILGVCVTVFSSYAAVECDEDARHYCYNHSSTYIAIVWPIAQGKQRRIEKIFKQVGKIVYQKTLYFTFEGAYRVLQKAHPYIADMYAHVHWYFPRDTFKYPARIFLIECMNLQEVIQCKYKIRELYTMQYRPVHINDTHAETLELAALLFNHNNLWV